MLWAALNTECSRKRGATLSVWRITTVAFARSAFCGEGARLYGGGGIPKGFHGLRGRINRSLCWRDAGPGSAAQSALFHDRSVHAARGDVDRVRIDDLPSGWRR